MSDDTNNSNARKDQPVTISAPPAAPVTIDPQNPLPEASFMWRRIFAAAICANALVFVWFAAAWLVGGEQWDHLYSLTKLMILGAGVILTYYFVAPSAAELTQLVQSASIIKHSLTMAAQRAAGGPETGQSLRFSGSGTPDSRILEAAPGEAPSSPSGDFGVEHTPEDMPEGIGASDSSSR